MSEAFSASACPACVALPAALATAGAGQALAPAPNTLFLSLPTSHCAVCIADVERGLLAQPGVTAARVNLSLKRVRIEGPAAADPAPLIAALAAIGYPAHELNPEALRQTEAELWGRDLLMRLAVAGFAMMNIMLLSVAVWSGAEDATRDLFHWLSAAIALPTLVFAGQPFFASAWASIKARRLGMDVPISLALILASGMSLFETAMGGHHAYFDAAVSLCFFLLIGRYLDYRSRALARSAAEELSALEVPRALRLVPGAAGLAEAVPVSTLRPGDFVRVLPGGRLPVDGVVAEGQSELDRALLTGETAPVPIAPGQVVSAGEVNLTGPLVVQVTAAGADSSLARMAALVAAAEGARHRYRGLADRMARAYSPVVHIMAFSAFSVWLGLTGDLRLAVNIAAATLIITCPCALALAAPAVVTAASGKLFRKGLLIKDGTALERLAEAEAVVFDKTGTLTLGAPQVDVPMAEAQDLALALALAEGSNHPLSQAIAAALRARGLTPAPVQARREVPGFGVLAQAGGRALRLGRPGWAGEGLTQNRKAVPSGLSEVEFRAGAHLLRFTFQDSLRPGAAELVARLQAEGRRVILLSGDQPGPVAALAATLGIAEHHAGVGPAEKAALLSSLAKAGARPLMVGDGLNDTAALAAAHVSISPASALDAARAASDIVLLGQSLEPVGEALALARLARRRIKENFVLSLGYNLISVPLALLGLATPLIAALAMSSSSLTVSLNALRMNVKGAR